MHACMQAHKLPSEAAGADDEGGKRSAHEEREEAQLVPEASEAGPRAHLRRGHDHHQGIN